MRKEHARLLKGILRLELMRKKMPGRNGMGSGCWTLHSPQGENYLWRMQFVYPIHNIKVFDVANTPSEVIEGTLKMMKAELSKVKGKK